MLHNGNVTLGLGSRKGSLLFQCIFSRESKSLENHLFCFQYLKLPTTQNFQFLLRRRLNFQLCEVDVLQKMKRIEVRDFRRQQGKRITQKKEIVSSFILTWSWEKVFTSLTLISKLKFKMETVSLTAFFKTVFTRKFCSPCLDFDFVSWQRFSFVGTNEWKRHPTMKCYLKVTCVSNAAQRRRKRQKWSEKQGCNLTTKLEVCERICANSRHTSN